MKLRTLLFVIIFIIVGLLHACLPDVLDCQKCKIVTYENGVKVEETSATQYCGTALDSVLNESPATVGNRTTQWECN